MIASRIADEKTTTDTGGPIALDALAYGIDNLEAILVVYLGDAHVHAAWVRADAGFSAQEIATRMRDAYRACQGSLRGLELLAGGENAGALSDPSVLLETPTRIVIFRRIRAYVVVSLFDSAMPIGMARLMAARLGARLDPELPYPGQGDAAAVQREAAVIEGLHRSVPPPPDTEVKTLAFPPVGAPPAVPHRSASRPPPPRATLTDLDRARRLLMFLESRAPEPHVARLRIALRAGLTPLALDHPEALRADAMILIETAVEDILGIDRSELRRLV